MENNDTGLLLVKKDIELHRAWFKQMCKLIGLNILHRSPKNNSKNWNMYGELDTFYNTPQLVGCIYEEHPKISTMKKLGWNTELQENMSIVHVPYDLENLQVGSLFIIPGPLDNSEGRVFRVVKMSTIQIYPASIACEIAPEYEDTMDSSSVESFESTDFNLLNGGN